MTETDRTTIVCPRCGKGDEFPFTLESLDNPVCEKCSTLLVIQEGITAKKEGLSPRHCPYFGEGNDLAVHWQEGYFGKDWYWIVVDELAGEYPIGKDNFDKCTEMSLARLEERN